MSAAGTTDKANPLNIDQLRGADPGSHAWVSASAGTGKTQVLVARLIRLLLDGADPRSILCLTFTKAGAAEMANRVRERLASWVHMDEHKLREALAHIGVSCTDEVLDRAPTLFLRIVDAPGHGLRIQTIHSFCQSLLESFPLEAGLLPGFALLESDAAQQEAQAGALAEMIEWMEQDADHPVRSALDRMLLRHGEAGTRSYLFKAAGAMRDCLRDETDFGALLRARCGLPDDPAGAFADWWAAATANGTVQAVLAAATGKTGTNVEQIAAQLGEILGQGSPPSEMQIAALRKIFVKKDGAPSQNTHLKPLAAHADWLEALAHQLIMQRQSDILGEIADALGCAAAFARQYASYKKRHSCADFDDLIHSVGQLLCQPGIGEWIQYKLDTRVDHILVDEAQDTNAMQWGIIDRLVDEYFAGAGQKADQLRTLFVVGDFKQAIYGFQGTSPHLFLERQGHYMVRAGDVGAPFANVELADNYRSTAAVLRIVDDAVSTLSPHKLGLAEGQVSHRAARRDWPGRVTLWPLVLPDFTTPDVGAADGADDLDAADDAADSKPDADGEDDGDLADEAEPSERILARLIARQVAEWVHRGHDGDRVRAGDILILLRERVAMAGELVARLHDARVPVEGVDRLLLKKPLAVQDLVAAARFAVQPGDDLSLACVLTSPLIGWTHDQLMQHGIGRAGGRSLREHLNLQAGLDDVRAQLDHILGLVDRVSPYRFFATLLHGPLGARRKLIARLGKEAGDAIDALLNMALAYSQSEGANLIGFLHHYDSSDVTVKRENEAKSGNGVRVMTVHGSKGLEAPIVILAETAFPAHKNKSDSITWSGDDGFALPMPPIRKDDRFDALRVPWQAARDAREEEHWRLMYVAMTRARDRLYVAGAPRMSDIPKDVRERLESGKPPDDLLPEATAPADSWYRAIAAISNGGDWQLRDNDAIWGAYGAIRSFGEGDTARPAAASTASPPRIAIPAWAQRPPAEEPRPPRPLAPSTIIADRDGQVPYAADQAEARDRGIAMHRLFQILPATAVEDRQQAATAYLRRTYPTLDAEAVSAAVCDIMADADFAAIFAPDGLAEVPLAAVVDGRVIHGQIDRLIVRGSDVMFVDYKSGRLVPRNAQAVPAQHAAQMAAYAEALARIYPGRTIRAGILYTEGPALIMLSAAQIEAAKRAFQSAEQAYPAG